MGKDRLRLSPRVVPDILSGPHYSSEANRIAGEAPLTLEQQAQALRDQHVPEKTVAAALRAAGANYSRETGWVYPDTVVQPKP
jgi:hypothetical protein